MHLQEPGVVLERGVAVLQDADFLLNRGALLALRLGALGMLLPKLVVVLVPLHVPAPSLPALSLFPRST